MNTDAAVAIAVLFILTGLYLGPWQAVCTAFARQIIFEKRDGLFDLARDGELRFDSPEYREIRSSLEKLIRFAHDLTLLNFLTVNWYMRKHYGRGEVSNLKRSVQRIGNPEVRKKVETLVSEAHDAILYMMLAKSVVALPFVLCFLCARRYSLKSRSVEQLAKASREWVQVEAEAAPVNRPPYAMAA